MGTTQLTCSPSVSMARWPFCSSKQSFMASFHISPSSPTYKELLTAEQLFYHVCFAKALWKARCQAIWCVNKVFWEAVLKSKKQAPPLEAQRSVVPLDDIDVWSVRTRRFI